MFESDDWTFTCDHSNNEWSEAHRLMGLRSTDMDALLSGIAYGYLHCPSGDTFKWKYLLEAVMRRIHFVKMRKLGL